MIKIDEEYSIESDGLNVTLMREKEKVLTDRGEKALDARGLDFKPGIVRTPIAYCSSIEGALNAYRREVINKKISEDEVLTLKEFIEWLRKTDRRILETLENTDFEIKKKVKKGK